MVLADQRLWLSFPKLCRRRDGGAISSETNLINEKPLIIIQGGTRVDLLRVHVLGASFIDGRQILSKVGVEQAAVAVSEWALGDLRECILVEIGQALQETAGSSVVPLQPPGRRWVQVAWCGVNVRPEIRAMATCQSAGRFQRLVLGIQVPLLVPGERPQRHFRIRIRGRIRPFQP